MLGQCRQAGTAAPGARGVHGQQPRHHLRGCTGRLLLVPVTMQQGKDWLAEQAEGVTLTGGNVDAQAFAHTLAGAEMYWPIVLLTETKSDEDTRSTR